MKRNPATHLIIKKESDAGKSRRILVTKTTLLTEKDFYVFGKCELRPTQMFPKDSGILVSVKSDKIVITGYRMDIPMVKARIKGIPMVHRVDNVFENNEEFPLIIGGENFIVKVCFAHLAAE